MNALILFSHGSLLCGAGRTLDEHAERLRASSGFPLVEVGYLNYSDPPFSAVVSRLAASGVRRFVVLPYFLVPGKFVSVDLPRQIATVSSRIPDVKFIVADPIGFDQRLAEGIIELAQNGRDQQSWRDDLRRAPEFCRANQRCPLYGRDGCPVAITLSSSVLSVTNVPASIPPHPKSKIPNPPIRAAVWPKSKIALLVLIHGSPQPDANREVYRVLDVIRASAEFPIVEAGFLECNTPDIPTAIDACVNRGATRVVGVPYFLHTGNHVAGDIPTVFEEAQLRHPTTEFQLSEFLGRSPQISHILKTRAQAALNSAPGPQPPGRYAV